MLNVSIHRLRPEAAIPSRGSAQAAGFDRRLPDVPPHLPVYRLIQLFFLLCSTEPEINCRGVQAFMAQKIRQQRNILILLQKMNGE